MAFPLPHPAPVVAPAPAAPRTAQVRTFDVTWNRPIFRPPSLPLQSQLYSDIPFTARSFHGKIKS